MGYTKTRFTAAKKTNAAAKAFLRSEYTWEGNIVISDSVVKGVYYCLCENADGTRWAGICPFRFEDDCILYNMQDQSMGASPENIYCPEKIYRNITPPSNENAKQWQSMCRARMIAKRYGLID